MSDVATTPANGYLHTSPVKDDGIAGEPIPLYSPMYKAIADGLLYRALNDTLEHAAVIGFAGSLGVAGKPVLILKPGVSLNIGNTSSLSVGETYAVSVNAGKFAPIGDVGSGKFSTILGQASAVDRLDTFVKACPTPKP